MADQELDKKKPLGHVSRVSTLPMIPKEGLTDSERLDYLERMMLMQSKQITRILEVLTE